MSEISFFAYTTGMSPDEKGICAMTAQILGDVNVRALIHDPDKIRAAVDVAFMIIAEVKSRRGALP